jgi:phosphoribosylformylglycinamidine synthase
MHVVMSFAKKGGVVIGICNGFQILLESGLLPGAMLKNKSLRFVCKYVRLKTVNSKTKFTSNCKDGEILQIPVAHGDGNYFADDDTLKRLQDNNQIVFQYCDAEGKLTDRANPNGSLMNIAGIVNEHGNVFGMMPHPERCADEVLGYMDGKKIFESLIHSLSD